MFGWTVDISSFSLIGLVILTIGPQTKRFREYFVQATQDFGYSAAKFRFDGESVGGSRTAEELDMEEGDCLDIEPIETEPIQQ